MTLEDECPTFRTIEDRKKQLKDSCFKCLKIGHLSKDCKKNKFCVYCGEVNTHHRSLFPQKFQVKFFSAHLSEEISEFKEFKEEEFCARENALVSSWEIAHADSPSKNSQLKPVKMWTSKNSAWFWISKYIYYGEFGGATSTSAGENRRDKSGDVWVWNSQNSHNNTDEVEYPT